LVVRLAGQPTLDESHVFGSAGNPDLQGVDPSAQTVDPLAQFTANAIDPCAKVAAEVVDPSPQFGSLGIDSQTDGVVGLLVCVGQGVDPLVHVASQVPNAAHDQRCHGRDGQQHRAEASHQYADDCGVHRL